MGSRIHRLARPQGAAVPRVSQVHRMVRQGQFKKLSQFGERDLVVLALARDGENDVVVMEALGIAESVQSVGHGSRSP
jgi:hypothetical protein